MAKPHSIFACTECGAQQPRWMGRWPEGGAWSTLQEERTGGASAESATPNLLADASDAAPKPLPLGEIDPEQAPRLPTGIPELDRVLGGGLVPG